MTYRKKLIEVALPLEAIKEGVASTHFEENFAYAEGWDEAKQRYMGLVKNKLISPALSSQNLIVKPEIANRQLESALYGDAQTKVNQVSEPISYGSTNDTADVDNSSKVIAAQAKKPTLKRFCGSVELDALRINRDASAIANEIIGHLTRLNGSQVKIVLEIEAQVPEGMPDEIIRTVSENCHTLKFTNQSFEQE